MTARVLVISFRDKLDKKVLSVLGREDCAFQEVAREELRNQPVPSADVVLLNVGSESFETGCEMLERLRSKDEGVPIVFLTKQTQVDQAVEIMKRGAFDYFPLPRELLPM